MRGSNPHCLFIEEPCQENDRDEENKFEKDKGV